MPSTSTRTPAAALVIYDGDCFFCQNYTALVRLKDAVGPVELLDARSGDPRIAAYWHQGYDLNEGMLFVYGGRVFYGHEATHRLALLSSSATLFGRINRLALSHPVVARLSYPLLKWGRLASLAIRGKRLMADPRHKK